MIRDWRTRNEDRHLYADLKPTRTVSRSHSARRRSGWRPTLARRTDGASCAGSPTRPRAQPSTAPDSAGRSQRLRPGVHELLLVHGTTSAGSRVHGQTGNVYNLGHRHPHHRDPRATSRCPGRPPCGLRAGVDAIDRSDYDFVVRTSDFDDLRSELPTLLGDLDAIAGQWDRLSNEMCWMAMLPGALKVDVIFPSERHEPEPPWQPSS